MQQNPAVSDPVNRGRSFALDYSWAREILCYTQVFKASKIQITFEL